MSILLAVSGWDANSWRRRLESVLPSHAVATLDEPFDRAAIRYALCWRHPPGALTNLPNLQAISRSAPVSIMCSPIRPCPTGRSCAWSIPISPTG